MAMNRIRGQGGGGGGTPTGAILFIPSMIELFAPSDGKGTVVSLLINRILSLYLSVEYVEHTRQGDNSTDLTISLLSLWRVAASSWKSGPLVLLFIYQTYIHILASVDNCQIMAGWLYFRINNNHEHDHLPQNL